MKQDETLMLAPSGLITPGVFCDFTLRKWRLQAAGWRRASNGRPSRAVPRWRCGAMETGFVLEIEE
ncbi:hypothetical protein [Cupriavidus sp. AcVe19-1a]|uniref:hypothetical protein n=1 Tax=Cupriavidus sp. AcVe19-1a TaxID=2821359 RepID=UPI001AE7208C|nr:hypothetical protein [Cupriavidus sp. AcVe19-1a]MBP0633218.1 hypothetical protein [Cupriavidus sp. AcVe19-1a]